MSELLKIDNVAVEFHARKGLLSSTKVQALDGVSIQLDKGETLALVGESGSGKTALARVCLRLVDVARGEVYFDGQNITNHSETGDLSHLGWMGRGWGREIQRLAM